jgi:hypothetical protein
VSDAAWTFPMGWIGLQVFFVISGLVMANSARTATPWDFAIGRFLPCLCGGLVRRGNQYHLERFPLK